jgi:hypothetical protein
MSRHEFPSAAGDALLIPRIEPTERFSEPPFEGMGVLIGPGLHDGAVHAVVTGRRGAFSQLLGRQYEPTSDEYLQFELEGERLRAYRRNRLREREDITAWPPEEGYALPFQAKDGSKPDSVTHIDFDDLDALFEADRNRYLQERVLKRDGIAAYGRALIARYNEGAEILPDSKLSAFHSIGVLLGDSGAGQITIANVGQLGARTYLLSKKGKPMSRGDHALTVSDGVIYGGTGRGKEKRIAKMKSRRLAHIDLVA